MMKGSNNVALGYDEGSIIVKVKYGATDLYMSYWDKGLLSDRVVCMGKYLPEVFIQTYCSNKEEFISLFDYCPILSSCSWGVKSQRCQWTRMERSFLPSIAK